MKVRYGHHQGVTYLGLWCPGCEDAHEIVVERDAGAASGPTWEWDGNAEAPTISPSILVTWNFTGRPDLRKVCHSFLRAGVWDFLPDSTHSLAGQQSPMVPWPTASTEEDDDA